MLVYDRLKINTIATSNDPSYSFSISCLYFLNDYLFIFLLRRSNPCLYGYDFFNFLFKFTSTQLFNKYLYTIKPF